MRRAIFALTTVLVIIFLMQSIAQVPGVEANPFSYPTISIESPKYYKSEIYQTTSIPIEVSVYAHRTNTEFVDVFYSLDGGANTTLSIFRYETSSGYFGKGILDNLTNGYHSLKIYSSDTQSKVISANRTFLVNTKVGTDNLIATLAIAFIAITISVVIAVVIHKRSKLKSKQSFL